MPGDSAAQFRRVNPLPRGEVVRILDGVHGRGHYVGTYCAWGVNNSGWWGEGELKFFIDGDDEFPTICGTGTEDYFCGSYNFDVGGRYSEFTTPYAGMPQVLRPDGAYRSQQRFGLYRWHLTDPIRFRTDLSVTMQALGWRRGGRYLQLQDDIATVAFWYQTLPLAAVSRAARPRHPRDRLNRALLCGCDPAALDRPCDGARPSGPPGSAPGYASAKPSYRFAATSLHFSTYEGKPSSGMNTRGLPGTLAPRYHELHDGNSVKSAIVLT